MSIMVARSEIPFHDLDSRRRVGQAQLPLREQQEDPEVVMAVVHLLGEDDHAPLIHQVEVESLNSLPESTRLSQLSVTMP